MDNFRIIYKILKTLEKAMSVDEFDKGAIAPERFKISQAHWVKLMEMLISDGYITGAQAQPFFGVRDIILGDVSITLKGLEYLQENALMKKVRNIAKGIADLAP